jgi:hypothetical protein
MKPNIRQFITNIKSLKSNPVRSRGASSRAPKPKFISRECLRMRESEMGLTGARGRFKNSDEDGGTKIFLQRTSPGNNRWASGRSSRSGRWADTPTPQHALETFVVRSLCGAPPRRSCTRSCPSSDQPIKSQPIDPRDGNFGEHDVQSCIYVSAFAKNVPSPSVKFVHLPKLQQT